MESKGGEVSTNVELADLFNVHLISPRRKYKYAQKCHYIGLRRTTLSFIWAVLVWYLHGRHGGLRLYSSVPEQRF